jgi:hypothetical protein
MSENLEHFIRSFLNDSFGHLQKTKEQSKEFYERFLNEKFESLHLVSLNNQVFDFDEVFLFSENKASAIAYDQATETEQFFLLFEKTEKQWTVLAVMSQCLGCFGIGVLGKKVCPICGGIGWSNH